MCKMIVCSVNGVETRLLTFGEPFQPNIKEVIVVITGSPGIAEFYDEFAQELYRSTQLPICVIGNAGHDVIGHKPTDVKTIKLNLDNQIKHKLDVINNCINKHCKLHMIGHSMGAWMLIELLQNNDYLTERICSINLLYPTLQKFAETPNGKLINDIVRYFFGIILLFLYIIQPFPSFVQRLIMRLYFVLMSWPSHYCNRVSIYLNPVVQKRSMALACECFHRINDLNVSCINKLKHLVNVLYSVTDKWVPLSHIEDLKQFEPHISLIELNVEHAFVLKYSKLVGVTVADLIMNRVKD